jgi:bifunctional non-homologous end joining protein LigD
VRVSGRNISISNEDKVFWPKEGYTKGDLISYYAAVAKVMVPHVGKRMMTLERFPDGIEGGRFFSKTIPKYFPEWIARKKVPKSGGEVEHVVCNDSATLVYLANQAAITTHISLSRVSAIDRPDQLIIDLDPPEGRFAKAREAAITLRGILEDLGLATFVKLTGSKGLHVMSPLDGKARFEEVHDFALAVGEVLLKEHPKELTMEFQKAKRAERLFVDIARNRFAQTVVSPYSVRARPGAPVAVPIEWEELEDRKLGPRTYTMKNTPARVESIGDPWRGWRKSARSVSAAASRLKKQYEAPG